MALFTVGDTVVIKDWNTMAAEYGEPNSDGDLINVPFVFTDYMKRLCG